MSKGSPEEIKIASHGLRGTIATTLADPAATHLEDTDNVLLKHHGSYQQDDRDLRAQLAKEKKEKAWSFMVRSKMPGGRVTAAQWLIHDDMCTKSSGTLRLTTRQGVQLHGVLKGELKNLIAAVNRSGLTTMGACGDVVRNVMGPAAPIRDAAHEDSQKLAEEISRRTLWRSSSYAEIWLDGEKVELLSECNLPDGAEDPLYGKVWLPRKFKMGISIAPRNDVDIFSQDVGFVPHVVDGAVEGYSIFVGGGFGMSHGQLSTRPFLAQPLGYVKRPGVVDATLAIVAIQRDHGNREERKQARMKYLVDTKGIEWFRAEVRRRVPGVELAPVKEIRFDTVEDNLGWHEQGDGRSYCAVYVSQGRVKDIEGGPRYRTAFREIAKTLGLPFVITPNTNLIIADIAPDQRAALAAILARHHIAFPGGMTAVRKVAHACVALPTCGLSLSESERVFSGVLDEIDPILRELKLESEPILIRMTGCPNGCARPYNADIGFVGRAPGKYAMFVGGSIRGDRLAGLEKKVVALADIPKEVRVLLEEFAKNRRPDERFTDYWGRTHVNGEAPAPEQFHVEFSERAARQAEARKAPESKPASPEPEPQAVPQESSLVAAQSHIRTLQLDPRSQDGVIFRQRLEIHLPATTDVAVYNAIFKSLREHFGE